MYIARRMTAFLVRRGIIAEDWRTMDILFILRSGYKTFYGNFC